MFDPHFGLFAVVQFISDAVRNAYRLKISFENPAALKGVERYTILSAIDKLWQEHLYNIDTLRNSIGLRAYVMSLTVASGAFFFTDSMPLSRAPSDAAP